MLKKKKGWGSIWSIPLAGHTHAHTHRDCGTTHLGRNASVLQQHSGPHCGVAGHEPPVPADLGGPQQGFGVQVGEDAEEGCAHLQDLWADHLVGFGGALFVAARLVVDAVRPSCQKRGGLERSSREKEF